MVEIMIDELLTPIVFMTASSSSTKTLAVRVRGSVPRWIHLVPSTVTQARFGPIWFLESCARWTAKERGAMAATNRVAARAGGPDARSRRAGIHDDASARGEA